MDNSILFLVGPRASGKTTVARALAPRLGRRAVDTDDMVRERAGCDIDEYVASNGWDAFRDLESEVLHDVCARQGLVVATGGGMVLRPENRAAMREAGLVAYLQNDADTLLARLAKDPNFSQRPPLTGLSPEEEMRAVLAEREPLYEASAHLALDGAQTVDALVNALLRALEGAAEDTP